ncbi:MAG: CocE/NonD family hydrolase, partial [Bacteroidota bacterium]
MVPVRDGVRLYTQVYTPKGQSQNYPFLFFRTPYSVPPYGPDNYRTVLGPTRSFDEEGFLFVFQDVRGKFRSEGEYILDRPIVEHRTSKDIDETTDIYDTIEWLLKNIPNNNGRVGQWGISAPGIQTTFGVMSRHPALVASSPQASPAEQFIGDDFHHNGAFRLMYVFSWLSRNARIRTGPTETPVRPIDYGTPDGYKFFMDLGPVANVNKEYFHDQVPTWNEYMEHPNYDQYWGDRNYFRHLTNINHAVLNVAGWFDAEDFYGAMQVYYNIEKRNPKNKSRLVVGPWSHGQWNRSDGDTLGHIRFGAKTSFYFRENVQLPFFNYYLKDK